MEIITSHTNADFDSLAAMVAAKKIYTNAVLVFSGSADAGVRQYLQSSGDWLSILHPGDVNLKEISKVIIVDTREPHRLGEFRELIEKPGVEVHVYDHHPTSYRDIVGEKNIIQEVGSTATIFTEIIQEKKIPITPKEATLFCTGIYVDTGSLTFATTTPHDVKAADWLLKQGADLKVVGEYLNRNLSDEQRNLLNSLIASLEHKTVEGQSILVASASVDDYIDDLAVLVHRLIDRESVSSVFAIVRMGDRIYVVGRSTNPLVNVSEILIEMGGAGHTTAASACLRGRHVEKVKNELLEIVGKKIRHRSALGSEAFEKPLRASILKVEDWSTIPESIVNLLKSVGETAKNASINVFVVGGFVRDLILGVKNLDLDLVVEGDGIAFARLLADQRHGSFFSFEKFGTASVILPDHLKIDVATARKEFYARPAALPEVAGTSIKQDLFRRDFSINGMAIKLNPPDFGQLIDFFNGQRDLQHGVLRVMHPLSFVDDPTRIFRAVRFEQRYQFRMDSHTEKLLKDALKEGVIQHLSMERVSAEIVLILSEPNPLPAIRRMGALRILMLIHPNLKLSSKIIEIIEALPGSLSLFQSPELEPWIVYAIALLSELEPYEVNEVLNNLRWSGKEKDKFSLLLGDWKKILNTIAQGQSIKPSALAKLLDPISPEGLIFLHAAPSLPNSAWGHVQGRILQYWSRFRKISLLLTGKDLLALGIKPGPEYRLLLEKLKDEQLDGEIKTKEEAEAFIKKRGTAPLFENPHSSP